MIDERMMFMESAPESISVLVQRGDLPVISLAMRATAWKLPNCGSLSAAVVAVGAWSALMGGCDGGATGVS
jgi:hypothetical protein